MKFIITDKKTLTKLEKVITLAEKLSIFRLSYEQIDNKDRPFEFTFRQRVSKLHQSSCSFSIKDGEYIMIFSENGGRIIQTPKESSRSDIISFVFSALRLVHKRLEKIEARRVGSKAKQMV